MSTKIYPIGIQNFEKIRNDGYLYIDKTALMYQMVKTGSYYFLSRPRRFGKSPIDYLHLRSWGMMILLGVLSVSSPYIILPIYFAIIYALIGIFFSISLVLNLQKKNIKIFPKLRKYTYTIFLLSWFSQSFCRTVLMSHFNFSYWPYITVISFISGLFISYGIGAVASRYLKTGVLARFLRISMGL